MPLTAYPKLEKELARQIREAALDHSSFDTPLKPCDLSRCRGMCCHDGVFIGEEEHAVVHELVGDGHLERQNGRWKTRTIPASEDQLGEGFAAHFPRTRCVFLDHNHHCRLQSQALETGKHPWFWKPFPCWLHPLTILNRAPGERPLLTLPTRGKDPQSGPDSPGFAPDTSCGRCDKEGEPAWKTLASELGFLSTLSGRNLLQELSG